MRTVYVRWYGQVLEGEVVSEHDLMGMVGVKIPLMGMAPVALFTAGHVYATETEARGGGHEKLEADSWRSTSVTAKPQPAVSPAVTGPSPAWQRLQEFKLSHWDAEKNRLKVDALDEFYRMWRDSVAEKRRFREDCQRKLRETKGEFPLMVARPSKGGVRKKKKKPAEAVQLSLF